MELNLEELNEKQLLVKVKKLEKILNVVAAAAKNSRLGIWQAYLHNGVCFWDEEMYRHYGVSKTSFKPNLENWLEFIHVEDRLKVEDAIYKALKGERHYRDINFRIVTPSGKIRFIEAHGQVIYDDDGLTPIGMMGANVDVTERLQNQAKITELAQTDPLTGLFNRGYFVESANLCFGLAKRGKYQVGICYLDLNHFKPINDTYGHAAGDYVLQTIAQRLKQLIRSSDICARFGGDEFVVILNRIQNEKDICQFIEKIQSAIKLPMVFNDNELSVSCAVGYSVFPDDGMQIDSLLHHADQRMYGNKRPR
ncbi:hypothetical protein C2869_03965 [Saccharobesus litoralis]|uniref:Diguanylate cyclase n=1 Tax=Saccharobesus litoralis TaxID=2172099 RepID=A0A2S0VN92_9ALTE|nr:sensor domain-containing diguanylate cyclase [Saccharobesus litoralis]AWB65642.1 hypothetical protein C2869_03965 [Saccharobesus litoralis]